MMRQPWRLRCLAVCVALLAAPVLLLPAHAASPGEHVLQQAIELRAGPDPAAPVVGRLAAGQRVRVLQGSADDPWLRIARPDGTAWGYVLAHALAQDAAAADPQSGASAATGGGGLFARSLGLAAPSGAAPAVAPTAPLSPEGSLFSEQVLRGDIDAAHAQRREEQRLAAIRQAEEERARQQAEAQRKQQEEQERRVAAARERERRQQLEYEAARADAESQRARQRQWAAIESSLQRFTDDMQRETDKTRRVMQDHARQQARQRREREAEQQRQRAQAQADARVAGQARAQDEARTRAEAQAAARARTQEAARMQAQAEQERAQQRMLADARQRAAVPAPSFPPAAGSAGAPAIRGLQPPTVQIARAPLAAPAQTARPPAAASGTSGAGIRLASVQREPGDGQPGRGSMRKEGLRVGGCAVASIQVDWSLGVLMGEATVMGSYTWQGDADCRLPTSTVVLLRLDAPGLPGGWLALNPVVPKAGERGFNVTGSPARSALLCQYDDARRGACLSADAASDVWTGGQVSDFVVAW